MPRASASAFDVAFARLVGAELKRRRIELEWSQEQLARRAEVSTANVRKLESGTSPATSFVTLGRLARALELSLDRLFSHFPKEP